MKNVIDRKKSCEKMNGFVRSEGDIGRISESCGVSRDTVKKWLKGRSFPSTANLYNMVSVLGVTMEDVLLVNDGIRIEKWQRS